MTTTEREQWLASRRKGLGSSDAPAVCGVSPFGSAFGVYLDKTGQLPELPPTKAMRYGLILEPAIAAMYELETGATLTDHPHVVHPKYNWMLATPDRRVEDLPKLVELKKANFFAREQWGPAGSDEIPENYRVQVMHQLSVTGFDLVDVAALIGDDFRVYHLERNDRLINRMIEIEAEFWEKVMLRTPPEPDWRHASTPELLKHLYGVSGAEVELADEELAYVRAYQEAGERAREASQAKDEAKAHLLYAMGEAGIGRMSDGTMITRKEIARKAYEVKATTYIDMRIKAPKGELVT